MSRVLLLLRAWLVIKQYSNHMEAAWMTQSNPDDEPVTLLRRSARLATKEKYHNDSCSEDTGDEVKKKLKASKDRRGQCQNKAKHSMKKKAKQPRKEPTSDDSDLNQEQQVEEFGRRQQKKKSIILRSKVRKTTNICTTYSCGFPS